MRRFLRQLYINFITSHMCINQEPSCMLRRLLLLATRPYSLKLYTTSYMHMHCPNVERKHAAAAVCQAPNPL